MTNSIFQSHIFLRQFIKTVFILFCMNNMVKAQQQGILVRISEIEVYPQHLEEYKTILKHEAEASVRLEPGVVAIFPMSQKENPVQVRILEIYQDLQAYQAHLKTEHFLTYKTSTINMVKSLKLMDMDALDLETTTQIFKK